jgi:hypothetical protein
MLTDVQQRLATEQAMFLLQALCNWQPRLHESTYL